ncbi:MAG: uroporphyrin-3 C-methyltransferase, partial [Oceanicoccus sp.]
TRKHMSKDKSKNTAPPKSEQPMSEEPALGSANLQDPAIDESGSAIDKSVEDLAVDSDINVNPVIVDEPALDTTEPDERKPDESEPVETLPAQTATTPENDNQHESKVNEKKTINSQTTQTNSGGKSGPGWWLWILSIVVALLAAAASFYLWQANLSQTQQQQENQAKVSAAIQRIDEQATLVRTLQRELDRQTEVSSHRQSTSRGELDDQLNQLRRQLASQQKRLLSLSTTDRADWLLAEADYLMRLANQRLLMGKEIAGALDLLAAADDIVRDLDDSALYPVREALADNMAALKAAGRFDTNGIFLQLGALARQSEQLRLFKLPELKVGKPEVQVDENWQQRLQSGFSGALDKLGNYVNYQKRDTLYKPSLSPEYESAVRQNLRLMFEQAQMALLSSKQYLYEESLQKAHYWLDTYYSLDEVAIASIKSSIEALKEQKIDIELPDISSSLRALKNYMDTIHQLSAPKTEEGAGVE